MVCRRCQFSRQFHTRSINDTSLTRAPPNFVHHARRRLGVRQAPTQRQRCASTTRPLVPAGGPARRGRHPRVRTSPSSPDGSRRAPGFQLRLESSPPDAGRRGETARGKTSGLGSPRAAFRTSLFSRVPPPLPPYRRGRAGQPCGPGRVGIHVSEWVARGMGGGARPTYSSSVILLFAPWKVGELLRARACLLLL
jgi:hypothetical protein